MATRETNQCLKQAAASFAGRTMGLEIEDLYQEAWAHWLANGKPQAPALVYSAARNHIRDVLRAEARWRQAKPNAPAPRDLCQPGHVLPPIDRLRSMARHLPLGAPRAIWLAVCDGASVAAAARSMEISERKAQRYMARAKIKVAKMLTAYPAPNVSVVEDEGTPAGVRTPSQALQYLHRQMEQDNLRRSRTPEGRSFADVYYQESHRRDPPKPKVPRAEFWNPADAKLGTTSYAQNESTHQAWWRNRAKDWGRSTQ